MSTEDMCVMITEDLKGLAEPKQSKGLPQGTQESWLPCWF
jgi:hypothetical protein